MKRGAAPKFKELGSSPAKQKFLNRAPDDFDWKAAKTRAKEAFKRDAAKKGHGTIKDLKAKSLKRAGKVVGVAAKGDAGSGGTSSAAITDVAGKAGEVHVKKIAKKGATKLSRKVGKVAKTLLKGGARVLGPLSVGLMAYDAYRSGKKHSGGKTKDTASAMSGGKTWKQAKTEGEKKTGESVMGGGKKKAGSIYDK